MKRWLVPSVLAVLMSAALVGCGGAIGLLLGLVALGEVVGDVSDWFDDDAPPGQFRVLLDGQLLPVQPDAAGNLALSDLPADRHLLQVVAPSRLTGAVRIINVAAGSPVDMGTLEPVAGGRILGTVTTQAAGGAFLAAKRVLVVALPGGAGLVDATHTAPMNLPPATTYYAAYTDGNGQFSLDAVEPGDYLVTAAVAGCKADVRLVAGLMAGHVVQGTVLDLELDDAIAFGTISGTVSGALAGGGTESLPGAGLTVAVGAGFVPAIPAAVSDSIAQASGASLMASPWFRWNELAGLTDAGGSYQVRAVPGTRRLSCFAYGYQPGQQDVTVTQGHDSAASFTLEAP